MMDGIPQAVDRFLSHMDALLGRSEHTVTNYAVDLGQFADYLLQEGVEVPGAIQSDHVRGFLRALLGFGYAKTSAARKLSAVKSWLDFLHAAGVLTQNPAASVRAPRLPARLPRALAYEDVEALLERGVEEPTARRDRAILELLYGAGLRVAELVAYCSTLMTLLPGDIITTGTPPGVGMGQNPKVFLKGGEVMRLGIAGLGEQTQKVVAQG